MKKVQLRAYAKINLSLDVLGALENGFHQVEMVMQQILLCDDIMVRWDPQDATSVCDRYHCKPQREILVHDCRRVCAGSTCHPLSCFCT